MRMGGFTVVRCEPLSKARIRVMFDNGVICRLYRREAQQFCVCEGAVITEETYGQLMKEVLGKRAKKRAMHLLEQMDRTEAQLRIKLAQGEYPQECIDDAVAYVKSYHYLDDYRYACSYIRCSQEKMSRQMLWQKLMQKGIARELIEQAAEEEYQADEAGQIRRLLQKRHFEPESADQKEFRRTYQFLLRRGFQSSNILKAMR